MIDHEGIAASQAEDKYKHVLGRTNPFSKPTTRIVTVDGQKWREQDIYQENPHKNLNIRLMKITRVSQPHIAPESRRDIIKFKFNVCGYIHHSIMSAEIFDSVPIEQSIAEAYTLAAEELALKNCKNLLNDE